MSASDQDDTVQAMARRPGEDARDCLGRLERMPLNGLSTHNRFARGRSLDLAPQASASIGRR